MAQWMPSKNIDGIVVSVGYDGMRTLSNDQLKNKLPYTVAHHPVNKGTVKATREQQ